MVSGAPDQGVEVATVSGSTRLEPLDLQLEVVDDPQKVGDGLLPIVLLIGDAALDGLEPVVDGARVGLAQGHRPERTDHHNDNHAQQVANHPASLPPDMTEVLTRQRYNEDQGSTEREVGYRKGWNDHARHMLRLLAAREAL